MINHKNQPHTKVGRESNYKHHFNRLWVVILKQYLLKSLLSKTFVTYNCNVTQTKFILMIEKCISPANENWYHYRWVWIMCGCIERYKSNARKVIYVVKV